MQEQYGDELNFTIPLPMAGMSRIEPGLPAEDTILTFPTWTKYAEVRPFA